MGRRLLQAHAQPQPQVRENELDLVERLPPEVLGAQHLRLALLDELADRADVGVLQAVGRAHGELELIDALVQVLVGNRDRRLRRLVRLLQILFRRVDVDEDVEVVANQARPEDTASRALTAPSVHTSTVSLS